MDKIEKIRQEIERQISAHDNVDHLESFEVGKAWNRGHRKALESLLAFLDTLSDEPDKSLEEAAEEYRRESYRKSVMPNTDGPIPEYGGNVKDAFIAGAEWQKEQDVTEMVQSENPLSVAYANRCFENGKQAMKEQMMKDAVEADVFDFSSNLPRPYAHISLPPNKYHTGDKVRIIIVKEENK